MKETRSKFAQTTLAKSASCSGIGLFTGQQVAVRMVPAPGNFGIVFRRIDLPGQPEVPADLDWIQQSPRCTLLSKGIASVQMVEHLLSALYGMGVDNLLIEVSGPEIPAGDGSSSHLVKLIEDAGIEKLSHLKKVFKIDQPIHWSEGETHLVALPCDEFKVSYTLHYPQSPLIQTQYFSHSLNPNFYRAELAQCRTFSLYEEIAPFIEKGLIKGGGLDNALVIQGDRVLNPGGARFPDEMVRHKVLDLIGDLSLLGAPIEGHIVSIRSGHASNAAFAKALRQTIRNPEKV